MLLDDVSQTSRAVASTSSRKGKIAALGSCLPRAEGRERRILISYLTGELPQRRIGIGWASLRKLPQPAPEPSLTISEVDDVFQEMEAASGAGSAASRSDQVQRLFERATAEEQSFLSRLISGELRQGASAGLMYDAISTASGVPIEAIRRAAMIAGSLPVVGEAALEGGVDALQDFHLEVGVPLQPMLAQSATSVNDALARTGPSSVEWKLDGVRVQIHRNDTRVDVFTRTLDRITDRVPEIVEETLTLPVKSVILDGETISLRSDGRPRPFQETGSRVASKGNVHELRKRLPLTTHVFDILHVDGQDLIDHPLSDRIATAERVIPESLLVPRISTSDADAAEEFFAGAVSRGHEGVVVKSMGSTYEAGRRGSGWVKVKPHHTLDLVILAAEWGHGRRTGFLSNLHLGAYDPETEDFVMLGKTFKGLTDEMLRFQTRRLQELEVRRDSWTVYVRPEMVVEIAFDGIQSSSRYRGGMALRFARVVRYRDDKQPREADTIASLRAIHDDPHDHD